ncbi:hypothetical protein [uncultured Muribaculum sp.]|uniref:hypothetical protein n=1 Tax=uncultured Muribaculum sp. TaxID=1918613 RepID=UPI0025AEA51F|nr:hypothetical protein [uncultured Muribaculum sp.]
MIWEFFAADEKSIESVGAVGAVFEEVFFGFRKFLAGLVFAEAVATAADPADCKAMQCILYGVI